MRVWITGGRGFVGRHLSKTLAAQDCSVAGIGHGAWTQPEHLQWGMSVWRNGEITPANLDSLLQAAGAPDIVFHLAGGSAVGPSFEQPGEDFQRSVVTASNLMEWVRLRMPTARVVMASSAAVYGAGHDKPIVESTPCSPYSPYGFNKRMAELLLESYAHSFGLQVAIVRLFSVYGPGLRKQLLFDACRKIQLDATHLRLGGTGSELRDWIHVEDAVMVLSRAAAHASHHALTINGGTGLGVTVREIAQVLMASHGKNGTVTFEGRGRPGDPERLVADTSRLQTFGIAAVRDWRAGIQEYVSWYQHEQNR